jgi:hypothetical protein
MAISVDLTTSTIFVPQADLTYISPGVYGLDVEDFRLWLKDWEDSEEGMAEPDTHRRNAPVTLSGTTYAQTFEILAPYNVTFENGSYRVRVAGGNHNIADVMNANSVSIEVGNSAGLVVVAEGAPGPGGEGGSAPTANEVAAAVWQRILEGSLTAEQITRIMLAALAGTTNGAGTSNEVFKSLNGAKNRISTIFDGAGNRSSVTLDGS